MNTLPASAALLLALALSACSSTAPEDLPRDVLSSELALVAAEMRAFGGISYDDSLEDSYGGNLLVIYTLGEDSAAETETELRRRFTGILAPGDYAVRPRPARGEGSLALAEQIGAVGTRAHRVVFDPTTGYVRVGAWTVDSARQSMYELEAAGVPLIDVIVQVEDRPDVP